jgi:endonuclease YncB( thermonuclease family)
VRTDLGGMAGKVRTCAAGKSNAYGQARDRYGRLLAVCYVGGEDLNERIVRESWALDYLDYQSTRRTTCRRN